MSGSTPGFDSSAESRSSFTPVPVTFVFEPLPLTMTVEGFLQEFEQTLLLDDEVILDWHVYRLDAGELKFTASLDVIGVVREREGMPYRFRVQIPGIGMTDMECAEGVREGEIESWEDFCPITYLCFRRGLGCFEVSLTDQAANKLHIAEAVRDQIVIEADHCHPRSSLYQALRAIFERKERQLIEQSSNAEQFALAESREHHLGSKRK